MSDFAVSDNDIEYDINHTVLESHWNDVMAKGFVKATAIYRDDAVLEFPQLQRTVRSREKIEEARSLQPPRAKIAIKRIRGTDEFWVTEYTCSQAGQMLNIVSIMEFGDGKVLCETEYWAERRN